MKLTQVAPQTTNRVLVFGPPKTGKTELVGKLSEYYNLIWFDAENGYVTLTKLPHAWQERINLISVPDSRTFPIAVETWMKVIKGGEVKICQEHGKVGCAICLKDKKEFEVINLSLLTERDIVVFDSLTQFSNSAIAHITKNQADDYKMDFDDWGNLRTVVEKFLSQVQAARFNIVCITHEEEVEFEDGKKKIVPVCGSSKSSRNTAKYFDHVVYAEVKNRKHAFGSSTTFANNIVTGSRTDVVLEVPLGAKPNEQKESTLLDIFTSWRTWHGKPIGAISNAAAATTAGSVAGSAAGNNAISGSNTGVGGVTIPINTKSVTGIVDGVAAAMTPAMTPAMQSLQNLQQLQNLGGKK